jgi:hypothetical protein
MGAAASTCVVILASLLVNKNPLCPYTHQVRFWMNKLRANYHIFISIPVFAFMSRKKTSGVGYVAIPVAAVMFL